MKLKSNKFVISTIALIVMIFVGNFLIDNPYTHSLANYYLNENFLKKLPVHAEYQSMRIALFPPSVIIYGAKVISQSKTGPDLDFLTVSTVEFKVSLWSMFMARPQWGDLELKDLNLTWPPPPEFLTALEALNTHPSTPSKNLPSWPPPIPPPITSLKISNSSINAKFSGVSINTNQDPQEITSIATEGLNLDIQIHDWKSFTIDLSIAQATVTDSIGSYVENGALKMRGEMNDNLFKARKFELNSSRLNFSGSTVAELILAKDSKTISTLNLSVILDIFQADMSLAGSFLDIPGCRGPISGQASSTLIIPITTKAPLSFSTNAKIKSTDSRFYDFRLYETESDLKIDLDKIEFKNTKIKMSDQSLAAGSGYIMFDKAVTYDFSLVPTALPMRDLLGIFNVDFDVINFDLTSPLLKISGIGDPFRMVVASASALTNFSTPSVDYDHTRHKESPQCDLDFDLRVDSDALTFRNGSGICRIEGKDTRPGKFSLGITGFSAFDSKRGINLTMTSDTFNPAPLTYFSQASLEGVGTMKTVIHGPYNAVKVDFETKLDDLIIGSTHLGSLNLNMQIADEKVTWDKINIKTHNGGRIISNQGSLLMNDALDIDFSMAAENVDHGVVGEAIRNITDDRYSVEFLAKHIDAKMRGPLMSPLRWQGDVNLDIQAARDRDYSFAQAIKGTIKGNNNGYTTEGLAVHAGGSNIQVTAKHTWDKTQNSSTFMGGLGFSESDLLEMTANIEAIPNSGDYVRLIPVLGLLAANYGISTDISGSAKFAGTLGKQTGSAKYVLANSKLLGAPLSDVAGTLLVDGSKLDIMAEQGGNAVKARVNLDFGKPKTPFSWYITAKNADFRPWMPAAMALDARNFAYLTATWSLQGTLDNWWESTGELFLKDLRLRFNPTATKNSQRLDFRTAHSSKIMFNGSNWVLEGGQPMTVTSSLGELQIGLKNHHPPSNLGITVNGKIDVATFRLFDADVETANGTLIASGGISGSTSEPTIDISVKNQEVNGLPADLALGFSRFRPSFQNILLDAKINSNGVTFNKISAQKGNGTISMTGFLARPGLGDESDMTINLDNASFLYPFPIIKYFDTSIDGQVKITGSGQPWNAGGRITIRKARSNRDVDIREAIFESLRSKSASDSVDSILPSLNLDIGVVADKSIGFSSRTGQAQLSSDLHIGGTDISPSILGLIDVSKGRFFYKRHFEIDRGLINFDDPIVADPALDISAVSDVSSYRVSIGITGRASAPKIDFTVDPANRPNGAPISKMEIIGLLSRGSLSEGGSQNNSESAAAAEALNLLAGQVEDTVQKIFDLSGQNVIKQVYIDTYADSEGTPIARFNLPLNITEDFDVILKWDPSTVKVSSEYSLHDSISLTGGIESINEKNGTSSKTSGAPADTGVDLKFKFSFQ